MTKLMARLFHNLDGMTDGANEDSLKALTRAWRAATDTKRLREALRECVRDSADELRMAGRETSTHYVWPLYMNGDGYAVAINEFKAPAEMSPGYATTLHNHRYSFMSLVLSGGYVQVRSVVELHNAGQAIRIHDIREDIVTEGDIVTIGHDEFHRLTSIRGQTVTLVVKCPPAKGESLSVDTGTLRVTRHLPVEARIEQLMDTLVREDE